MTKKHFIDLADRLRRDVKPELDSIDFDLVVRELASFCRAQNPRFDRERWIDYIYGRCGPSGGKVKAPAEVAS